MGTTLLFTFMSLVVMTSAAFQCPPPPWRLFPLLGNNCYMRIAEKVTWNEAQVKCKNAGGTLISIENMAEDSIARQMAHNLGGDTWIGLNDRGQEGRFVWENKKNPSYTNWMSGQPDNFQGNEDCVHLWSQNSYLWNDNNCETKLFAICEKQATMV